jgi:hypothetical protein
MCRWGRWAPSFTAIARIVFEFLLQLEYYPLVEHYAPIVIKIFEGYYIN